MAETLLIEFELAVLPIESPLLATFNDVDLAIGLSVNKLYLVGKLSLFSLFLIVFIF